MGYYISINYLTSKEVTIAILQQDAIDARSTGNMEYARAVRTGDPRLDAFITVFSNAEAFPDPTTLNSIIDEGFAQIGVPKDRTVYENKKTTKGVFEILCRPGYPKDAHTVKMAVHEAVSIVRATESTAGLYSGRPAQLYRYGKRVHLTEALKLGRFRIAPATFYNDITDDPARQDDELMRKFERDPSSLTIITKTGETLKPSGPVKFVSKRASDYYVLCLSMEYSKAVTEEFKDTNACLVIKDPAKFAQRLHAAMEKVKPDFAGIDAPVSYGTKSALGVCFTKKEGYAVQSEFRFAWTAKDERAPAKPLEPFFVEIGSIEDIAELRDLPA